MSKFFASIVLILSLLFVLLVTTSVVKAEEPISPQAQNDYKVLVEMIIASGGCHLPVPPEAIMNVSKLVASEIKKPVDFTLQSAMHDAATFFKGAIENGSREEVCSQLKAKVIQTFGQPV